MPTTTIDATLGGAAANSYVTLTEAQAYMAERFGSAAFTALSSGDQEIALKQACRELDRHRIHGLRNSTTQALQFPRAYPYNTEDPRQTTEPTIPVSVKWAQCEQALWLAINYARGGQSQRQQLQSQGVKSFGVGDLREEYSEGTMPIGGASPLCPQARQLFDKWICRTALLVSDREELSFDNGRI